VTWHDWAVKWGPLERGDILDGARLGDAIGRYDPAACRLSRVIEINWNLL
jgi:hypothetical protein